MTDLALEYVRVDALIPYARNSRTHSDEQILQIAGSIKEFGFTNPVLITPTNDIIAGHGRVRAAAKLGMESVPCIYCDIILKRWEQFTGKTAERIDG
jgi:ParB-like chromosome segregation protein Spo0J